MELSVYVVGREVATLAQSGDFRGVLSYHPQVAVTSKMLNFTACLHYVNPGKTFCHASLPTRPGSPPLGNNIRRQTQGNKLPGTCRLGAATLFNHSATKQVIGELWQLFVFHRLYNMRIHTRKIRAQSTERGVFVHDHLPFAC